jgi:hypothetical protein
MIFIRFVKASTPDREAPGPPPPALLLLHFCKKILSGKKHVGNLIFSSRKSLSFSAFSSLGKATLAALAALAISNRAKPPRVKVVEKNTLVPM